MTVLKLHRGIVNAVKKKLECWDKCKHVGSILVFC